MRLHDTHCHLSAPAFQLDVAEVIARARDAGVTAITVPGYDAATNEGALELARQHEGLHAAVGFHPHDAKGTTAAQLAELESLVALDEVVAVGEIGLDFYRDLSAHDVQRRVLGAQLEIAIRASKPVLVHSRAAEDEILEPLAEYAAHSPLAAGGRPVGVMHCFGGTVEQARRFLEIGFVISVACTITYPGSERARGLARQLPLESLVVETDSPYLPPQGQRGRRNEPANVAEAVMAIAAARGERTETVAEATRRNAARLIGLRETVGAASC